MATKRHATFFRPLTLGLAAVLAAGGLSGCEFFSNTRTAPPLENGRRDADFGGGTYVVQSGDTVYAISRRYDVPVRSLIDANALSAPFVLRPGQRMILPLSGNGYVVTSGDTLYAVSRKTGVSVADLARINNLSEPYTIKVGQRLALAPRGSGAARSIPAPQNETSPSVTALSPPPPQDDYRPLSQRDEGSAPPERVAPAAIAGAAQASQERETAASQGAPQVLTPSSQKSAAAEAAKPPEPAIQEAKAVAPAQNAGPVVLPNPPKASGTGYLWPVKGPVIQAFGATGRGQHNDGINIAIPRGTPVVAAENGVVAYAGNEIRGFGNLLLIKHADGWVTAYAHNDRFLVQRGAVVKKGQQIALSGDSGSVSPPQLHFEVRRNNRAVDPMTMLGPKTGATASVASRGNPG